MKTEYFWAILGIYGLYLGTYTNKKSAIREHCEFLGYDWKTCRRKGDRVIRVVVNYENKNNQ